MEERWEVRVGQMAFTIDGRDFLLGPGDAVAAGARGARAVAESRVPTTAELRELMRAFPDELALAVPLN